jgi:hypothetical protein
MNGVNLANSTEFQNQFDNQMLEESTDNRHLKSVTFTPRLGWHITWDGLHLS